MSDTEEEKFRAFFLAAYLADSLQCLPHEMKAKLVHIVDQLGFDEGWQKFVENDLGLSQEWVRDAFRILTQIRPPSMAVIWRFKRDRALALEMPPVFARTG